MVVIRVGAFSMADRPGQCQPHLALFHGAEVRDIALVQDEKSYGHGSNRAAQSGLSSPSAATVTPSKQENCHCHRLSTISDVFYATQPTKAHGHASIAC